MRSDSIKFEISILHTAILGIILVVFSGVLFLISNSFLQEIDQQLKVKAQAASFTVMAYLNVLPPGPEALGTAVEKTITMKGESLFQPKLRKISQEWFHQVQTLNLDQAYINFVSKDATQVISSENLDRSLRALFLEDIQFPRGSKVTFRTLTYNQKNIRVINYPLSLKQGGRYLLQVGISQEPIMQQLQNWLFSIAISVPLILLVTRFVGRMLAARILEPVQEITEMANKITHQDLSARIKPKHFDREMGSLVESFNDMIARLEKSFKHIEEFSYHVAHELKTPLTIIKGEADLLLRKERSKHEYQQALGIVLEESERVLKTIEDLLLLTKLDYQPDVFKFEDFDFLEFFSEIGEQSRILAAKKAIAISMRLPNFKSPLKVKGDKLHLRRLFSNITDNAIKFTPEGGHIDLKITKEGDKVLTSITDTGPGIAADDLEKIFEKFFRTDNSTTGTGLGLNIAWTIAKLHKGEILVDSQLGRGTTFKVFLPSL